jgi:hypothetical protein
LENGRKQNICRRGKLAFGLVTPLQTLIILLLAAVAAALDILAVVEAQAVLGLYLRLA